MVTMKATGEWYIDTAADDVFFYFSSGTNFSRTSKLYGISYDNGARIKFSGSGFKYDDEGFAVGTKNSKDFVKSYSFYGSDGGVYISGMRVKLSDFAKAEKTASPIDDSRVWASIFSGNDKFVGGKYNDYIYGFNGNDLISGRNGHDILSGDDGNDKLYGGAGQDKLDGGAGRDRLDGGAGDDVLIGGKGADKFVFSSPSDTIDIDYRRDVIEDFNRQEKDKIDLSSIDANINKRGDQAFKLIGMKEFHEKAGELRYIYSGGDTIVQGDIDGDALIDFAFEINSIIALKSSDFIL